MKSIPFAALIAFALCGCDRMNRTTTEGTRNDGTSQVTDRDNTGVNERDRDAAAKTPIDQNENKRDVNITADIRKKVVATKMSVNAQNVKIITQDGKVTLRGPVKNEDEKKQIEDIARDVAGAGNVDSQIEVEHQP
jgi:osmotically-inducible protein OsmY